MCFSGLDPSGSAGLQADLETLFSLGYHSIPIPTLLTAQDTKDVCYLQITEPNFLELQARTILSDTCINFFKIGVLGSVKTIQTLHSNPTESQVSSNVGKRVESDRTAQSLCKLRLCAVLSVFAAPCTRLAP